MLKHINVVLGLVLGLESQVLGLGLEGQVLGLGLGLGLADRVLGLVLVRQDLRFCL